MSSQTPRTIAIARSLGQAAAQILRARPPAESRAWGISSRSSPARAVASGPAAVATPVAPVLAMADHLPAQPVGDGGGQPGDLRRVDPPWARDRHAELLDHPARAAAEHDHPVAEPDRLAHVV